MIKLEGTVKLQPYFENSCWVGAGNDIESHNFSIDIEI